MLELRTVLKNEAIKNFKNEKHLKKLINNPRKT